MRIYIQTVCFFLLLLEIRSWSFSDDYSVHAFAELHPMPWFPGQLQELGLEWSALTTRSSCGKYLVLGGHEPGVPDNAELIVFHLQEDRVVWRTRLSAPIEFLDWCSRGPTVAYVNGDGDLTFVCLQWLSSLGRSEYVNRMRLQRYMPEWREQLSLYIRELYGREQVPLAERWQHHDSINIISHKVQVLVQDAAVQFRASEVVDGHWVLPQVTLNLADKDVSGEFAASVHWAPISSAQRAPDSDGLLKGRAVASVASHRAAQIFRRPPSVKGFQTSKSAKVVVIDINDGSLVYQYALDRNEGDFSLKYAAAAEAIGTSPCGEWAIFSTMDPYRATARLNTKAPDTQHALLMVRMNAPWKMRVVLVPSEPIGMYWTTADHALLVFAQPFEGLEVRAGGLTAPTVFQIDFSHFNAP